MNFKLMNRLFAGATFLLALVTYIMTVQPSVAFWDCGEFAGASIWQQVPHPPGAPLFLMIGKLFHIFIPFGDPGWRLNMVSAVTSALTVLLLYLIAVKVMENFAGKAKNVADAVSTYGAAMIAGAALTFSDTFWFNAVESEVYAASTLFVALITYLMMVWNEKADEHRSEKYLLLIVYLIGLSSGVHLLALLTLFAVFLLVYLRKYEFKLIPFLLMGIGAIVSFFTIYPFVIKNIPAYLAKHTPGRDGFGKYAIENSDALQYLAIGIILFAIAGFIFSQMKNHKVASFIFGSFLLIIIGYTTYTQILIRSNANSPMNENEPKNFTSLAYYLGREQYGNAPMKERRYQTEERFIKRYVKQDQEGEYVYGPWYYPEVDYSNAEYKWPKENFKGDMAYMWKFQMGHMFWRYFGWNFVGRVSDVQDAGVAKMNVPAEHIMLNHDSGYIDEFPIRFFALPLLLGLFGLVFHFYRDPKRAIIFLALFLLLGVLAALQQNQQDPQPRERDYFYAGAFFIWALWIGMGAKAIIESIQTKKKSVGMAAAIIAVLFMLVPVNMATGGWKIHSRAGNYLPFDYSYNILQSCEHNAIIFTNGDNDTFPVWYLQDVMGVRRDIRVVNLSLGNTLWYVDQLKNRQPWGTDKIPLTFSDESLHADETSDIALQPIFDRDPQVIHIPVKKDILKKFTDNQNIINNGTMSFRWMGLPQDGNDRNGKQKYYINHQLVRDIMEVTKFERPVYFSTTVGPDVFSGLGSFLRLEGMAWRICPVQQGRGTAEAINPELMYKSLMENDNTNDFHTEQHYGFKFRNLNNMDVYYDEVHRRLMDSYRHLYFVYADYALSTMNDKKLTAEILDKMNENISPTQFPMDYDMCYKFAMILDDVGAIESRNKMIDIGIARCELLLQNPEIDMRIFRKEIAGEGVGPYRVKAWLYQMKGDFGGASSTLLNLKNQMEPLRDQLEQQVRSGDQANIEKYRSIESGIMSLNMEFDELHILSIDKEFGVNAAMDTANAILNRKYSTGIYYDSMYADYLKQKIVKIQQKLGYKVPEVIVQENE